MFKVTRVVADFPGESSDGVTKCVKACPAAALTYMPWKDRSGEPARRPTHGYLPEENANQCSVCHG